MNTAVEQIRQSSTQKDREHDVEANTPDLTIRPDNSARIWGRQFNMKNERLHV